MIRLASGRVACPEAPVRDREPRESYRHGYEPRSTTRPTFALLKAIDCSTASWMIARRCQ